MFYRKTVRQSVKLSGIGLHSGNICSVIIYPSLKQTGLVFKACGIEIIVSPKTLKGSNLGSNLEKNGFIIKTVEHLLSALVSLGITDAQIDVQNGEIPILDGSSICFINEINKVGLTILKKQQLKAVTKKYQIVDKQKSITINPLQNKRKIINFEINFDNDVIAKMPQKMSYIHNRYNYENKLASARTFGFKKDLQYLFAKNLCLGGSLLNAILIDDNKIINKSGLRFEQEIVAHKVLDIIGDLQPLFQDYTGFEITAVQSGHQLNNQFLNGYFQLMHNDF